MSFAVESPAPKVCLSPDRSQAIWSLAFLLLLTGVLACQTGPLEAQLITPPQSLWGDVDSNSEAALESGNTGLLTGLLMGLVASLCVVVFLVYRRFQRARRADSLELGRLRLGLMVSAYGLTPALGLATIVLGGQRLIFGVELAFIGISLSLVTIAIGTLSLVAGDGRP